MSYLETLNDTELDEFIEETYKKAVDYLRESSFFIRYCNDAKAVREQRRLNNSGM